MKTWSWDNIWEPGNETTEVTGGLQMKGVATGSLQHQLNHPRTREHDDVILSAILKMNIVDPLYNGHHWVPIRYSEVSLTQELPVYFR